MRLSFAAILAVALASAASAAGNGAGAGGAGLQRAINSGLPPGQAGPAGAPNNPRRAEEPSAARDDRGPSERTPAR